MARVYEALDEQHSSQVAVKVLHPECARDSIAVERFRREYQVGSQLRHRNIVHVFDFEPTDDGSYMLVMEFLVGEELRSLLRRESVLAPARLVRMLSQAALAMDFAHHGRWVHRDLKPDNLFLCQTAEGDIVKILDFGSVKDTKTGAKQLTVMGTTIGSPFYMSPEQAQALPTLDHRTDVWALAAMCYEAVTGRVPFSGPNGPSILMKILGEEPARVSRNTAPGGADAELDRALRCGLAKDPLERTPTAGALADEIGRALGLEGDHTEWAWTPEVELGRKMGALPRPPEPSSEPGAPIQSVITEKPRAAQRSSAGPRWGVIAVLVCCALLGALLVVGLW
jgi:serine/threonine-protein kinase